MKAKLLTMGALLYSLSVSSQNIVTIDKSKQYQVIDGFGTQYGKHVYWGSAPYYDDDHLKRIIDDLGISMHRTWIDPKLEMTNDNNDPNNTDLAKFKANLDATAPSACDGEYVRQRDQIAYMKVYQDRALKNGDSIKFFASVLTPPSWMKYVGCTFGTDGIWNRMATFEEELAKGGTDGVGPNKVKDFKDEFAEFVYGTVKTWKDEGIDFYAVGMQNEPAFPEPYGSCVYSPEAMTGIVAKVGTRFKKEGIKSQIIFPEDIGDVGRNNQYVMGVSKDPVAKDFGHIFGVHQYTQDGVTPGSLAASTWGSLYKIAQRGAPRHVWMTETSGFGVGTKGMRTMSSSIYAALKFGYANAFNWYDATDNDSDVEHASAFFVLKDGKQLFTKKGNAFRHYSKYIRPGAISVDAMCSTDADILPLAFQDNYRKRLTIVLINNDSVNTKTVSLKFMDTGSPKKFLGYRTSGTEDFKRIDSISSTATITLPPNSISTYIGNNSKPAIITSNESEEVTNNQIQVQIYPNPAKDNFTIQLPLPSSYTKIILTDITGKEVMNQEITKSTETIDVTSISKGLYILTLKGETTYRKTLVVE